MRETASTLCFCCSPGAIHIQPNGGILLAHSRTHVYTQLFFTSLGLMATNKQEKFTFPKAVRSGPQNKTDKSDCGISACRWARAEGGKGKWRAEERKRGREIAHVCLREVSCGCPFADLIYSEGEVCVCVVGVECTVGLHDPTCAVFSHPYAGVQYMLAAAEDYSGEAGRGLGSVCV